jgi:hypothetical protein
MRDGKPTTEPDEIYQRPLRAQDEATIDRQALGH